MRVQVAGIVQGVGFRPFVYRIAIKNGLKGYVRNRGDAGVEIHLQGEERAINNFLRCLKEKKPPLAQIHDLTTTKLQGEQRYAKFTIHKSSEKSELSGSVVPPDIAICNDCLRELRDPKDPRRDYFFITCTNCGPRFTTIEKLPYDRKNTTMREFPMCSFCRSEYDNPLNRRFHAQTVADATCGPKVNLTTAKGETVEGDDPVREAGKLLSEGFIVAVKGYGGFHVAASISLDKPLTRLRAVKHRSQKPFAIMSRSLESIRTFAEVSREEAKALSSYARPILLLNKSDKYDLSDLVAPGLHNVGVMLPYTGLHYMLFDSVEDKAFVMTSANPSNQPIIKDNDAALVMLGGTVDYFLFHNRQIAYRCDDSVARSNHEGPVFIRRSRGYAPSPILLKDRAKRCVIGLGGELNTTSCILLRNKAFASQHIGDVENVETRDFLEDATMHLIRLTNSKVEAIGCDLNPKFTTTALAREIAEKNGWQLFQVQHHFAHIAALMVERAVDEIVGVCCDGYGYGTDGEAWGGEVLLCTRESTDFERVAHLERQPLVGGDVATRYPLRMAAGILNKRIDVKTLLKENKEYFPHGEHEVEVVLRQLMADKNVVATTSCGRILDAVAAVLGVCYERTYEGEPAMKLESLAMGGKNVLKRQPAIDNDTLNTTELLLQIHENKMKHSKVDLAYSAHVYLANGLARLAIDKAVEYGVGVVGFSGGAAVNEILTLTMRKSVKAAGLRFLVHRSMPPGDGGLSFGQVAVGGFFQD